MRATTRFAKPLSLFAAVALISGLGAAIPRKTELRLQAKSPENVEIEPNRPRVNVLQVELDPILEGGVASAAHLPKARHSRNRAKTPPLPGEIALCFVNWAWPRADQAHFSTEHVNQLRQFVDASSAKEPPHRDEG